MACRIVALVPMRHDSQRVVGKNYRSFAGRPLYHHIILSLLDCTLIDEVVIDTDSSVIMEDAAREFPQVRLLDRPEHLRADTVPMNEVLLHDVQQIDADYYLQTHSTNPLLRSKSIAQATELFLSEQTTYDSLFGVTRLQVRLWNQLALPVNHNPSILLRTQDLPPVYMENSNLYIFSRTTLEQRRNRIGDRPLMFEVDSIEAWDIDDENGFRIAELLYHDREKESRACAGE